MKQLKRTSMLKMQNSIRKEEKIQKWTEKKLKDIQGMSMVDPSILATAAYHIIEGKWLRERVLLVLSTVVTFIFSGAINQMC